MSMKTVSLHYICDECGAAIDVSAPPGLVNVDIAAPHILNRAEHGDFCSVQCAVSWFQAKTDAFVE